MKILLNRLLADLKLSAIYGDISREITGVTFDSREVTSGSLFVALKGTSSDGHKFIKSAILSGASAIVCEEISELSSDVTTIVVENSHIAMGHIASALFDHPSQKLKLVGITGTNGKTTTVTLLHRVFTSMGYKCGLISTIANYIGERRYEATHTTPDPLKLNSLMAEMADEGCEFCFMEVSSHSLDQHRVSGLRFCGAIFSNITHDHLDYHKTFIEYIRVKKSLFDNLNSEAFALTNLDDKNGMVMVQNCKAKVYTYSCLSPAGFNCRIVEKGLDGMLIKIDNRELWTKFIGAHNAYNILAVYSAAILLGADKEELLISISSLESVAGRLEYIKGGEDITAVVDYAHTPDALENVLKTLKDCAVQREIITVFGCGGDRDKTKRPEMAAVSVKYSNRIVVTSDNPRFEDPEDIINDIRLGFEKSQLSAVLFITDRREAIRTSVALAKPGSIILVAGKGHETYQDIKGVKHHFDDKEILAEIFNPQ
ncbi:MAG: UDP-N-acetylmuramoyl-L-alanyl-D-glutamate--2,6-diaminopimelate ligase [Bacteroidetes bacterium GWF2_41_61]|nr:MAG: UDP-N-acetylmuramoyl-L-alanyl-D-glutamate--2,6-diaminopimelate ligase [Bacteroidetes bacterium GWE2_40_15]OFY27593.1 MAG: UDP-N-acetylmuramoyl-L-alanyl-D-glutamate--2,6-diaminopimelate ligase [Bacteroidetes bacterium GWF2_41_61]OFY91082.1 MAG: UDP-N-acetylmuramoyl-L-alanyl-D-glutamate--2,6-diaminopimelate ligase [Bacteroidetes bacterium RIFOXYA12_FULL_40_10]HBG25078.1 UDP-N-acetylmuramoyl-L-alanyl-D-glutamate--2,6-diaminopimelate ligase [Rikenellaceae bacterium]HBZ24833.1 UDP-N-acetylmu